MIANFGLRAITDDERAILESAVGQIVMRHKMIEKRSEVERKIAASLRNRARGFPAEAMEVE